MKMTKKLLVLMLTLVLAFSMAPSVFAATTSDEVVCEPNVPFTVTFTVENVVGVQGTVSGGMGRGAVFMVTDLQVEGLTEGTVEPAWGTMAVVSETPATLVVTATVMTSRWAFYEFGQAYPVSFDYQYTTDGTDLEWGNQVIYVTIKDPSVVELDYTAIDQAILDAETILSGDTSIYTPKTLSALEDALANAKNVRETATTQEELDAATEELLSAIEGLKTLLDFSALKRYLRLADSLVDTDYTAASWAEFIVVRGTSRMALTYAKTQEDIDTATENLRVALSKLVKLPGEKADTSKLEAAIAKAEALKKDDYTLVSWEAMTEVLNFAKAALVSNDQTVIDEATADLEAAMEALVKVVVIDYEALKAAIAAVDALKKTDYTATSWNTVYLAYLDAKANLYSLDQTKVDAAAAALNSAVSALVKMNLTALEAAVSAAKAYTSPDDRSARLWTEMEALYGVAESLKTSGDQAAVDACAAEINTLLNDIKTLDATKGTTYNPSDLNQLNPVNDTLWNVFFWVGVAVLIAMVVAIGAVLILFLVVKKKKDDTPVVDYDISDDD